MRPAKTQITLGIRPVWSESSLSAWSNLGYLATHWAHSEDSDQTGWMPRLIWVFAICPGWSESLLGAHSLCFSCRSSYDVTDLWAVVLNETNTFPWKHKNLWWLWGADRNFLHKGKCSTSRGLPSVAEQLSRMTEFSISTEQPLWILFLAYFSAITFMLETVLSNLCSNNYIFQSRDVQFSSYLRHWCRNVWWKTYVNMMSRRTKWCQNRHYDVMHESRLTPLM